MRQKLISASLATCLSVASVNSVIAQEPLVSFDDLLCDQACEDEKKKRVIYNNCVISKSKGVDRSVVILEVRSVCRKISENPTIFQRLRWGR